VLVDTDVLIWYFRGNAKAKKTIEKIGGFSISAVVYMELLQGVRNKNELMLLKRFLIDHHVDTINIDSAITSRAIYYLERFNLSHGIEMADALVAGTADQMGLKLLTGNVSHYKMIPGVEIKKFTV